MNSVPIPPGMLLDHFKAVLDADSGQFEAESEP